MNAPTIYHGDQIPFADLQKMAEAIAKSGLFGMKEPNQALALMLTAQAEGQHPATITQDYDIIQGKATRKTNSVLARFQQAGGKVEWHELSESKARATFSHPSGGALLMEWSIGMAQRAGLTEKDNWRKYPRAMLRARTIAEGVRAVYPAAIGGYLVPEEAADLDAVPGEVVGKTVTVEQPKAIESSPAGNAGSPAQSGVPSDSGATNGQKVEDGDKSDPLLQQGAKETIARCMERNGRSALDVMTAAAEIGIDAKQLEAVKCGTQLLEVLRFSQMPNVMRWLRENPAK